jgi:ribonuclease HI
MLMPFFMNKHADIKININNMEIKKSNIHHWLGIHIDKNLTFGRHIREIKAKAIKKLDLIKKIAGSHWGGHPSSLGILYKGLFRNQIDYGNTIFTAACKSNIKSLEVVNRQALRRIGGLTNSTPVNSIDAIIAEPPLKIRWQYLIKKYCLKAIKNKNAIYNHNIINMRKEILYIKSASNVVSDDDTITVNNNNRATTYKGKNYSSNEFTFLKLIAEDVEIISSQLQTVFKSWTEALSYPPFINKNIKNIDNKKNFTPLELQKYTLKALDKFDANKCIYTDASKKQNTCSIGIALPNNQQFGYKLRHSTSITQAELKAIKKALELAFILKIEKPVTLTDSLNSCILIEKHKHTYKHDKVMEHIITAGSTLKATIQWIPSHVQIRGNELADRAAKKAADPSLFFEEIYNNISYTDLLLTYKKESLSQFQNWYDTES